MESIQAPIGVIPAAGKGLRMSNYSVQGCKELITIAGRSMLLRTIDELRLAGITEIVVVTSPTKPAINSHLEEFGELERGDIRIVTQSEAMGLVDAVRIALESDSTEKNRNVLVAFPDVLFHSHPNPTAALIESTEKNKHVEPSISASVITLRPDGEWGALLSDSGRVLGLVDSPDLKAGQLISGIAAKNKGDSFPLDGPLRIAGRGLWSPDFWRAVDLVREAGDWDEGEMSDAAVLRRLAAENRLVGIQIKAAYIDIGMPEGLAYARRILNDTTPLTSEGEGD